NYLVHNRNLLTREGVEAWFSQGERAILPVPEYVPVTDGSRALTLKRLERRLRSLAYRAVGEFPVLLPGDRIPRLQIRGEVRVKQDLVELGLAEGVISFAALRDVEDQVPEFGAVVGWHLSRVLSVVCNLLIIVCHCITHRTK